MNKTEWGWNWIEYFWVVSVFITTPCRAAFIIHVDTWVWLLDWWVSVCDTSLYICRHWTGLCCVYVIGSPWRILMCFFMCALLNQSSVVSAANSVLLHLISIQKLFVSPYLCAWDNVLCVFPCPQGPSCCHKETLHQRPDCVRSVAPVCVGMERIRRCHGELRSWIASSLCCVPVPQD